MRSAVCLIVLACGAALAIGGSAVGAPPPVTISFDDLAAETVVTSQYHVSYGVDFGVGPQGEENAPKVVSVPAGVAASGTQVLAINTTCGTEFCPYNVVGKFASGHSLVTIFFGPYSENCGGTDPTFVVYNAGGDEVGRRELSVPFAAKPGVHSTWTLTTAGPQISFFRVFGSGCRMAIDEVRFDALAATGPPDFTLKRTDGFDGQLGLSPGSSRTITIHVSRFNGSSGNISLAASGLPGVTASFDPAVVTGSDDVDVKATITAGAGSDGAKGDLLITGTPVATAGTAARSVAVPTIVELNYDVRILGLEVTQGAQTPELAHAPSGATYGQWSDVPLIRTKQTIVRVYADAAVGPAAGVPGVNAFLYAHDAAGKGLPLSPILPEEGARTLPVGSSLDELRIAQDGAFTFTLPAEWTQAAGAITLVAQISGPGAAPGLEPAAEVAECAGCTTDNGWVLNGVKFVDVKQQVILPVELDWTRGSTTYKPGDPASVFSAAIAAFPFGVQFVLAPYQQALDVSAEANIEEDADGKPVTDGADLKNEAIWSRVSAWAASSGVLSVGVIGVIARADPDQSAPARGLCPCFTPGEGVAVVDEGRPLTSVAHELGHLLGLDHADADLIAAHPSISGCGGVDNGGAQKWPDYMGGLEGVALDPRPGSGGGTGPYKLVAVDVGPEFPINSYDLMSYCAHEDDSWLSPINVKRVTGFFKSLRADADVAAARRAAQPVLQVLAFDGGGGRVQIGAVLHTLGTPTTGSSPYQLTLRNAGGAALAGVSMTAVPTHVNRGGRMIMLTGTAPDVAGATEVDIALSGRVAARRAASANPPQVSGVSPRAFGARSGSTVAWTASDPDGGTLTAAVDYSLDGSTWRNVWSGPNRGSVTLPNFFFGQSRQARLRVRVNDGFNEASALSDPFAAPGAPPSVRITSPRAGQLLRRDATLYLSGEAFSDQGNALHGNSLRWFVGGRQIATGDRASATALPAGRTRIQLVAQDENGKRASVSTLVRVQAVAPVLLRLLSPRRLSPRATAVTLSLSASLPSILDSGGQRSHVDRTLRRLTLGIRPGTAPLALPLRLTADGKTSSYVVRIRR